MLVAVGNCLGIVSIRKLAGSRTENSICIASAQRLYATTFYLRESRSQSVDQGSQPRSNDLITHEVLAGSTVMCAVTMYSTLEAKFSIAGSMISLNLSIQAKQINQHRPEPRYWEIGDFR